VTSLDFKLSILFHPTDTVLQHPCSLRLAPMLTLKMMYTTFFVHQIIIFVLI
jgi:hypothetical protein